MDNKQINHIRTQSSLMKRCRNKSDDLVNATILHTAIASIYLTRSVFLEGELLTLHAELVSVALANSLNGSTTFLNQITTTQNRPAFLQLLLDLLEHNLVVLASSKIGLVNSKEERARMGDEGGIDEQIIQRSTHKLLSVPEFPYSAISFTSY